MFASIETMTREEVIESVRSMLTRAQFEVSNPLSMRGTRFDIIARRDEILIIIKVLSNVDAFSKDNAEELLCIGQALGASPILVGERSGSGEIEAGIIYSRFGIPIISVETLADYIIEGVPPLIFAASGGFYVKIDSELMHKIREERNISLGTLAEIAGVSRRTIQMYEGGMGAMIDAALRLEEYLDQPILMPIDPFAPIQKIKNTQKKEIASPAPQPATQDVFTKEVFNTLSTMGFSVTPVTRSPFEALAQDSQILILTALGKDENTILSKAASVSDISRITGRYSVLIIERGRGRENIGGTPLIDREELKSIDETYVLYDIVSSRGDSNETNKN